MPPKPGGKPDPKAAKGKPDPKAAKAAAPPGEKPKGPPIPTLPDGPPIEMEAVQPEPYDPRKHEPPIFMSSFWDYPGRRPQVRPTDPPMCRPGGGAGGAPPAAAKGKADPKGKDAKGKVDPKAKGADAKKKK